MTELLRWETLLLIWIAATVTLAAIAIWKIPTIVEVKADKIIQKLEELKEP